MTEFSPSIFAHLADLHLAPRSAAINKMDPITGRRVRDLDMTDALINAVDDILEQEPLPAVCVIAGDIFDTYAASQDAIIDASRQIKRMRNAGIKVIGIAGNHDTPTQKKKTPAFAVLKHEFETIAEDDGVVLAYDDIKHVVVEDIEYVLLPHSVVLSGNFEPDDLKPTSGSKYSVLVVHGVAAGDPSLRQQDEMKEVPIAKWIMDMDWNYVAFGHYHYPGWVPGYKGKAAYCGSLENTVISGPDVCGTRGPVYVDVSKPGEDKMDMHPQPIRKILVIPEIIVDNEEIDATELDKMIEESILSYDTDGAIVHNSVKNVPLTVRKSMPRRNFQSVNPNMLYIKTRIENAADADYIPQMAEVDENEVELDEEGNPILRKLESSTSSGFKPLSAELHDQLELLIANGDIKPSVKEKVEDILTGLLA